jgi:hypothetical protein
MLTESARSLNVGFQRSDFEIPAGVLDRYYKSVVGVEDGYWAGIRREVGVVGREG